MKKKKYYLTTKPFYIFNFIAYIFLITLYVFQTYLKSPLALRLLTTFIILLNLYVTITYLNKYIEFNYKKQKIIISEKKRKKFNLCDLENIQLSKDNLKIIFYFKDNQTYEVSGVVGFKRVSAEKTIEIVNKIKEEQKEYLNKLA